LHDGIDTVELQPGDFELALLGVELLPERPQFTEELGARSGRARSIGGRAAGPSAHGTDEQSGQHDYSAAYNQTLSFRLHTPPCFATLRE